MITTRENDWHPHVNAVPWMQKARPGLQFAKADRPMQIAASPIHPSCVSPDPNTQEIAMPTNARKQRLLREAHETEGGEIASAGNDVAMIVAAVLMLAIYWGAAAIAAGTAMNWRGDVVQRNVVTLKYQKPMGGSVPATSPQNRAANFKDSGTQ